jgi:DNA-binding MarR family transcriptional regulator
MTKRSKKQLVSELIREFRTCANEDAAFESLAAAQLGVSESDLRCINIIENAGGLTAGELAVRSGLSGGAITGVIDRLERAGLARRVHEPADRRRVRVQVTAAFEARAERIWGPLAADWHSTLSRAFTPEELERITDFLRAATEIGRRHADSLGGTLDRSDRRVASAPTGSSTPSRDRPAAIP